MTLFGQEVNSFKTISSGTFTDLAIWEIYDGSSWIPASSLPNSSNDIYIDQTHTLTLSSDQSVKSLFINAETGAGQKLNLNGNALEIFGTLQAFTGAAPGTPTGTWNSTNWIGNSIDSRLIFKGGTRTIIPADSWSGFSIRSRYSIIFDPGDGIELTIEEPIKSMRFIVRSGTLIQRLDTSVNPASCPTISFNSEDFFSTSDYGDFVIEDGGTFVSDCNSGILFRSSTRSASLFEIQDGGELILEGDNPEMEVVQYELNGKVTFASGSSGKAFLSKSYTSSSFAAEFHDLELNSTQNLTLPGTISISGDLIQSNSGNFDLAATNLEFTGSEDQQVLGFPLIVLNLTLDKADGEVSFDENLSVLSNLEMISGGMDFNQNSLSINLLGLGDLDYLGGYWRDLADFTYFNIPSTLTESNFTLPFLDQFQGGIRKVQLLGTGPIGNMTVSFTEFLGADTDPQFDDSDGTTILYRLFSYFQFAGITPTTDLMELRISGDELIVNDVDDLRIVGTGYAAPGAHLSGLDPVELWARRSINFEDLEGPNFTIGSYRTLSILPVLWLNAKAETSNTGTEVQWKVASEKNNKKFEIYRSPNGKSEWAKIGEILSLGDTETPRTYSFMDSSRVPFRDVYYQIRQIDFDGKDSYSEAFLSKGSPVSNLKIYPNPHTSGMVKISIPDSKGNDPLNYVVTNSLGQIILDGQISIVEIETQLVHLPSGIYVISVQGTTHVYQTRWIKQ